MAPTNAPPPDLTTALTGPPGLALALNASINDVAAIATALGVTASKLTPMAQPGSLADIAMLASIASALDVVARYGISGATLVQLSAAPAISDTASAAMAALQAQYPQSAWFGAIQPVEDGLRQKRDALVAYLLGPGLAAPSPQMLTTDDIFDYYLIDPEMSPCALMTRLLQASVAIQQFVQQCFLNLFFSSISISTCRTLYGASGPGDSSTACGRQIARYFCTPRTTSCRNCAKSRRPSSRTWKMIFVKVTVTQTRPRLHSRTISGS
jgi:ABC toxin-like protein